MGGWIILGREFSSFPQMSETCRGDEECETNVELCS